MPLSGQPAAGLSPPGRKAPFPPNKGKAVARLLPAPRSCSLPLPLPSHTRSRQETRPGIPPDPPKGKTIARASSCASEPQSNGISKAYAKAAEFIAPQTPVTTAIALKTSYDNKYGAPSEGKPKVFVKYFYVNTATGEKSGDMLALAVLEADED